MRCPTHPLFVFFLFFFLLLSFFFTAHHRVHTHTPVHTAQHTASTALSSHLHREACCLHPPTPLGLSPLPSDLDEERKGRRSSSRSRARKWVVDERSGRRLGRCLSSRSRQCQRPLPPSVPIPRPCPRLPGRYIPCCSLFLPCLCELQQEKHREALCLYFSFCICCCCCRRRRRRRLPKVTGAFATFHGSELEGSCICVLSAICRCSCCLLLALFPAYTSAAFCLRFCLLRTHKSTNASAHVLNPNNLFSLLDPSLNHSSIFLFCRAGNLRITPHSIFAVSWFSAFPPRSSSPYTQIGRRGVHPYALVVSPPICPTAVVA